MFSIIKGEIERHVGMIDVNIHKLHNIFMCYLPQQLHYQMKLTQNHENVKNSNNRKQLH